VKYIANPVEVDAFKIVDVFSSSRSPCLLRLENGTEVEAFPEMTARFKPSAGDYWVIQSDGYIYLNPKEVFERKYRPFHQCPLVGCKVIGSHTHPVEGPAQS